MGCPANGDCADPVPRYLCWPITASRGLVDAYASTDASAMLICVSIAPCRTQSLRPSPLVSAECGDYEHQAKLSLSVGQNEAE